MYYYLRINLITVYNVSVISEITQDFLKFFFTYIPVCDNGLKSSGLALVLGIRDAEEPNPTLQVLKEPKRCLPLKFPFLCQPRKNVVILSADTGETLEIFREANYRIAAGMLICQHSRAETYRFEKNFL